MFEQCKRKRFNQKILAAIAKLDHNHRKAIHSLPDSVIIESLESGYRHTDNKIKHTIDILFISAWLHAYHRTD